MAFRVDSALTGIHSRSEETVRVSREFDRGRVDETDLKDAFERDAKNLVEHELRSGITLASEGQLKWQDLLRPFSENVEGLVSGADLSRWFDTNSFYRKPTVTKEIKMPKKGFPIENYAIFASFPKQSDRKHRRTISLPGPYTLASLVDDKYYGSKLEIVEDFAKVLASLIKGLVKNESFESILLSEPALVYRYGLSALTNKKELESFVAAFNKNLSNTGADLILHTYFGDCSKILPDLLSLDGLGTLGIDFTQTPLDDIENVEFDGKALGCACIDGRNSLVETPEWISDYCSEAVRTLKPSGLVVLPSCELKYLPRVYADKKVDALGRAARMLRERLGQTKQ